MIIMTSTSVSISSYLLGLKLQNLMTNKSLLTDMCIFFYLEPYASGALAQSVLDGKRLVLTAAVATPIYLNHFLYQRQQASVGFLLQLSPLWSLFIPASSSNTRLLFFFCLPWHHRTPRDLRPQTGYRVVLYEGKLRCAGRRKTCTRAVQHLLK